MSYFAGGHDSTPWFGAVATACLRRLGLATAVAVLAPLGLIQAAEPPMISPRPAAIGPDDEKPMNFHLWKLRAAVSAQSQSVPAGDNLSLEVVLRCVARSGTVFNPFFDRTLPLPARVVVFSSSGQYVGDLVSEDSAQRHTRRGDWWVVQPGAGAGTSITVPTNPKSTERTVKRQGLENSEKWQIVTSLGTGRYSIQAIYCANLLQRKTEGSQVPTREYRELGRSNLAQIEVVAQD